MITRAIEKRIQSKLNKGKALILLGARQTGKTTLLKAICKNYTNSLWLDGDDAQTQAVFEHPSVSQLKLALGNNDVVIIDEAQRIKDIGIKLKLITDHLKKIQLIATGSSSFDLANTINEPLTGRKWEFQLFPLSFQEMVDHHGYLTEKSLLEQRMIYGYYPEIVNNTNDPKEVLKSLTDSYLYKDILMWEKIKKPDKVLKLLQALAFQVGNQVSYNELGQMTGLNNETVEKYILLLEQTFIIFRLKSFSRNLRNEIKHSRKIYFYDNGIRNAIIANYNALSLRQDVGALWENFILSERKKHISYHNLYCNTYFWRNHDQQEIDYIEESGGKLSAYEFKWKAKAKNKFPNSFVNTYNPAETKVITPANFEEFIMQ